MYPGQRKATLQDQAGYGIRKSSGSQRRASTFADSNPGPFSAPVARLSKWPKNIFFASDFIAEKAAAATSTSARRRRPRQRTSFSTDARVEERDRRTSTGSHSHEPVPRHRVNQGAAACRSSDSREEAPQSAQREESRPDVARGEEGGTLTFLEESASALLLLHSRFFGGVRQEEDIVCRLCMLCREAGWMGNPLTASPDLDPLVLEKMVLARLRRTDQSSTNSLLHSEDEVFSFEAFYRVLADVATLVYPREGKAMRRLLLEGVLPLAADNEPRMWSPRPEVLYGRPALAALRMQRHALHQLYCTYESIARTEKDADGISRGIFLKMLAHLGVTPVSVSEQHAASVFDDALRNGLAVAEPPFSREQRERRKGTRAIPLAGKGREHPLEVGNRARVPFSSSRPWDNRLCWSNFLEAMAALAVGAVKGGHAIDTATTKRRKSTPEGERPAQPFQALENHADDEDASCLLRSWQSTSVLVDPSSGGGGGQSSETICRNKHSAPPTGEKMIQEKPLRSGWGRDGRRRSEGLGGNGSAPPREGFTERRQEEPDHGGAPIDDATMNFEAASATIFDELLDPRVVAVYSSHRKELQALFQRYSTSTSAGSGNPDGDGFRYVSMKIGDAGIWRFVGEFPVLLRWAEGDSILRLILRASCNRGWHRCGKGGEEAAEQPLGLTYFGFLEVVTRMAYASRGRSSTFTRKAAVIHLCPQNGRSTWHF
eukprot:g6108.t3